MSLTWSQTQAYAERADIWRSSDPVDPDTKTRAGATWARVVTALPCALSETQNDDDPMGLGRMKRRSSLTEDEAEVEHGSNVRRNDLLVNTSNDPPSVYRVMGPARNLPTEGLRTANCALYQLMSEEKPPAELVTFYGL